MRHQGPGERLARLLYRAALALATPWFLARLAWRNRAAAGERGRWAERLGRVPRLDPATPRIWLHAVSVGEAIAIAPLVHGLRSAFPAHELLISTTTPTGREQVERLYAGIARHLYFPFDLPPVVARYLRRVAPSLLVLMETELWPELILACERQGVPVVLANARLSQRSLRAYRRGRVLALAALNRLHLLAARSALDARRFAELGVEPARIRQLGNLKHDALAAAPPAPLLQRATADPPVWIAGSTHPGEEVQVLDAHREVRRRFSGALLLLAPRKPHRGEEIVGLCEARALPAGRRSRGAAPRPGDAVFVIDTLGELPGYYASADVAFVGGSLVRHGGHNPFEPAGAGVPVVTGPWHFNFESDFRELLEGGGATLVDDADTLARAVAGLLGDPPGRARQAASARRIVDAQRGASARLVEQLRAVLS